MGYTIFMLERSKPESIVIRLGMENNDIFAKYHFNPFQFTGPDWWMRDFHRRHIQFFRGCKKVLDLGAGRGFFLEELCGGHIVGVGVENHEPSVRQGEAKGLNYFQSGIDQFFQSEKGREIAIECDGVYCAHVIEHLEPAEVFELFRNVKAHCAPGVRARFITNNPEDIGVLSYVFWGDLTHKRLYPGQLLEAMALSQGFATARSRTFLGAKLGKKDQLLRLLQKPFWGRYKWLPNLLVDCH